MGIKIMVSYGLFGYALHPLPKDIDDLKQKILTACDEIPSELIRKSVLALKSRSTKVLQNGGSAI